MSEIKAVCVFCGARQEVPKTHLDAGKQFGEMLAKQGVRLVFGGGDCGIMGAVANAALKAGGQVTGVFPRSLKNLESAHAGLSETVMVETMHERKQIMFERSDAVVVLPGGFGTLDEMFEIITWKQLRFHQKPIVIFNHEGYWDPLIKLMENIIATGFARELATDLYTVVDTVDTVFDAIR